MVRMDKDSNTRKRKKSIDDNTRNCKKSQWTRNGSGSEEEDEDLFSWEEYLQKCHAKAVPKETFKHVQDTKVQGFVPGMKLECLDRSSLETDTYWVATVIMASGPLLLLRYDGYDDDRSGDFWCDAASEELQPIGWSARTNNILIPPSAIRHKASNWAKFLMQDLKGAVYAPEHLFHDRSDPEEENQLKPGLKLEVLNKDNPVSYWVASVVDAYGLRLRLRHEGSQDEAHDVWVYFLSDCVHQLGWGKKNDLTLKVPTGLKARHADKDWPQVRERLLSLCQCSSEDASLNKSLQKTNNPLKPHGFTTGMKLEAVNPKDPSSICAATVSKVPNETFFQVEIDSLISCGDGSRPSMWCNSSSKNIFPVGWCEKNSIQLTPPPGYLVHPFRWQTYFEWTNSSAAPDTLFTLEVPSHTFEIGMKLEAVDQTNPSTMTVATVTQVVGRTVWVLLDGYKNDSLEHIYDVESYDLYPAGWCSMNGHPLLTPRVQRPQEENRRLASLRTRQRETKKTAVTSDTTNTTSTVNTTSKTNTTVTTSKVPTTTSTNTTNITKTTSTAARVSSTMSTDTSTTNKTTNTTSTTNITKTTDTTSTANSDQSTSATTNKADTPQVGKEATVHEGIKQEGGLTDQRSPVKGPYDLRASTLMPRDYVSQMGPTEDDPVEEKKNVEAVIDLTGEEEEVTDKTVKPPPAAKEPVPAGALVKNELGICIYVRKTCEPGPFLKQSRLAVIPPVIGPAGANVVLRQLVEQIVLSAHSSKQVLKLLAAETDKMTIASILKTLRTKLSLCENLISLHRVALCAHCDASRLSSISPSQNLRKNSGPLAAGALENSKPTVPLKTAVPRESNKTAARPEKATAPRVNSEPATRPEAAVPQANSVPTARTERVAPLLNREPATTVPRVNSEPVAGPKRVDPRVSLKPGGPLENAVQKITREQEKTTTNSPARTTKHITQWNVKEVVDFIRTSDCRTFAEEFQKQEIDGRALTLLSLDEIHKCLGVTLGPAIKLHFAVQKLRKKHR